MALDARTQARLYGAGRVVLGLGLVVAPARFSRAWLGSVSDTGGGQVAVRGLGVRDMVIGGIMLHTVDTPGVGVRWARTCALADAVDAGATLVARRSLPSTAWGVVVLAVGGAVQGALLSRSLRSTS